MNTYKHHRFPADVISHNVWLYHRFNLSHRDIEDLLAERGITVSHEAVRLWRIKFGSLYAGRIKRKHQGYGDTFYIDEIFVKINGKQHYFWRAVDQDGEVVDAYLQTKRDRTAAKGIFKRLLKSYGGEPKKIVTDKLTSYDVGHRELISKAIHETSRYVNNRAELSHQPTRVRKRGMWRFNSQKQVQLFLGVHAAVYNLFNLKWYLVKAEHYRNLRIGAFSEWSRAVV